MLDNLQKQFNRLLKHADLPPPTGMWDRIEGQLPRRRERGSGYRYAAALFFLVSSATGSLFVYERYWGTGIGDRLARSRQIPATNRVTTTRSAYYKTPVTNTSNAVVLPVLNTRSVTVSAIDPRKYQQEGLSVYDPSGHTSSESRHLGHLEAIEQIEGPVSGITAGFPEGLDSHVHPTPDLNVGLNPADAGDYQFASTQYPVRLALDPHGLLVSVGITPVGSQVGRNHILAELSPAREFDNDQDQLKILERDPERACEREKRLQQFREFDVVRGLHLGAFISQTSTWMTRKQDYTDHPGNVIDPRTYVGMAFGFNAGYDIDERWGIQTELAIRNSKGQHFDEICSYTGQIIHKELHLWYLRVPLMVKYRLMQINRQNGRPIVLGVLAGPQLNVLYRKQLFVNDERAPISSTLINHMEIGAVTGIDLDFYLHKNLYLTTGTRLSITSPLERQKSMGIQLGFTLQFNFRVPPREKF